MKYVKGDMHEKAQHKINVMALSAIFSAINEHNQVDDTRDINYYIDTKIFSKMYNSKIDNPDLYLLTYLAKSIFIIK